MQALVIVCTAESLNDDVLSKLNYVLAHNAGAEQVSITQFGAADIAQAIAKSGAIQIEVKSSTKKYSEKLNNALNKVGDRLLNQNRYISNDTFLFVIAYTKEKAIHDAFKLIAQATEDEVRACPAGRQYPYTNEVLYMIRKIANDL